MLHKLLFPDLMWVLGHSASLEPQPSRARGRTVIHIYQLSLYPIALRARRSPSQRNDSRAGLWDIANQLQSVLFPSCAVVGRKDGPKTAQGVYGSKAPSVDLSKTLAEL